jgi:LysM repeat protein
MQKMNIALLVVCFILLGSAVQAQSLKGSSASMKRQNQLAVNYGYSFLKNSRSVNSMVSSGYLLRVTGDRNLDLHDVSFPYARPEVKLFIDRLSAQYRNACGEKLTVTSLVRPMNRQPANASKNSVHPTGMAVDLRVPSKGRCRTWLERTLLSLEASDALDVTRERRPPHYHVAVYTQNYKQYVANLLNSDSKSTPSNQEYLVRRGDSLWEIASRTGSSVAQLRAANNLNGNLIKPGQKLLIAYAGNNSVGTLSSNEIASLTEISYQVKKGDSLWSISNRYGTTVGQIRVQNNLSSDFLHIGQVLRITSSR